MIYWDACPFSSVFLISESPLSIVSFLTTQIYIPTQINLLLNEKDMEKQNRALILLLSSSLQHLGILSKRKSQPDIPLQHSIPWVLKLQHRRKLLQALGLSQAVPVSVAAVMIQKMGLVKGTFCCIFYFKENKAKEQKYNKFFTKQKPFHTHKFAKP